MICYNCGDKKIFTTNFGDIPLSLQYNKTHRKFLTHKLELCQCNNCGIIFQRKPIEFKYLKQRYKYKFVEPEFHLDSISQLLVKIFHENDKVSFSTVSYKDNSLADRLDDSKFKNKYCIDKILTKHNFLSFLHSNNIVIINNIVEKYKKVDLLIQRHSIEHVFHLKKFINRACSLLSEDGIYLIEVPNVSKSFKNFDYTVIWDEHNYYFTEETIKNLTLNTNFQILNLQNIHNKNSSEDILVIFLKKISSKNYKLCTFENTLQHYFKFIHNFNFFKFNINRFFKKLKESYNTICFIGIGHHCSTFLHIFNLYSFVDQLIDQSKVKRGKYIPNVNKMIKNSSFKENSYIINCINDRNKYIDKINIHSILNKFK